MTNTGDINAQTGISSEGGHQIVNSGKIDASLHGIDAVADGTVIRNLADGVIDGLSVGIQTTGQGSARIVNAGEIIGGVLDGEGRMTLVNTGSIIGDINLGAGDDSFDTRKGDFDSVVYGGFGDDTYKVSRSDTQIGEAFNEGYDKVFSSASFSLTDYVEDLTLTGRENIEAGGNDLRNIITGNKGRNDIYGYDGDDILAGGRGNDHLFGGAGADSFAFTRKTGRDVVEDFEDGVDFLGSPFISDAKEIEDLLENHASQKGADVVIRYGNDQLIIRNMDLQDLSVDDFVLV